MKKLLLKDITLVLIETREHKLARMAVEDCLRVAEFGDVLILTDKPEEFDLAHFGVTPRIQVVKDWESKLGWSRSFWFDVPPLLRTAYTLNIQWDSWIWDTSMWRDEYLEYDFCGSPWWYKDGKNVGNSGFSLISTRLKRYLYAKRAEFPCDTPIDDDLLCRGYRSKLEDRGFRWAPERLAHEFAFECCRPSKTSRHFGFHAAFNFDEVLEPERFLERARLMLKSPYITNPNGVIWKAFSAKHPELIAELTREADSTTNSAYFRACPL